jgi:hypothetical protein
MGGSRSIDDVVRAVVPRLQDTVASEIRSLALELAARADEVRAEADAEHEASLVRERERAMAERAEAISLAAAAAREEAAVTVALRVAEAVRRLDEQTTLSGVLDALADLAAAEAGRAVVLVGVDGGLQFWRAVGFDAPAGEDQAVLAATDAGIIGRAIDTRRSVTVPRGGAGGEENGENLPPAFATLPTGRAGVAVPVMIGGEPLVAVYADQGTEKKEANGGGWIPVVEILASHAGSRLEAVVAERAAAFARDAVASGS